MNDVERSDNPLLPLKSHNAWFKPFSFIVKKVLGKHL